MRGCRAILDHFSPEAIELDVRPRPGVFFFSLFNRVAERVATIRFVAKKVPPEGDRMAAHLAPVTCERGTTLIVAKPSRHIILS